MNNTGKNTPLRRRCPLACENCRRRKERCNGLQPCQRCRMRSVAHECNFGQTPSTAQRNRDRRGTLESRSPCSPVEPRLLATTEPTHSPSTVFTLNDYTVATALQNTRAIVRASIGTCTFTEGIIDPVRNPPDNICSTNFFHVPARTAPVINQADLRPLVESFLYSTAGILNLFDAENLQESIQSWNAGKEIATDLEIATFYLVLALGAQTCPDTPIYLAEQYHGYGRYLGLHDASRDISYASTQFFILITTYLLGESLLEAAFMQHGSVVRAASILGLGQDTRTANSDPSERRLRQRLWKTIRIVDITLCMRLGKPIATTRPRHRDECVIAECSAATDICDVLESVITEIYTNDGFQKDAVPGVIEKHREIVSRFRDGLKNDGFGAHTDPRPDLGLYHTKHASYAIIQLLTMPYLFAHVSNCPAEGISTSPGAINPDTSNQQQISSESMVYACVDSAISLVDLFQELRHADRVPRRLPLVAYAMFYASISLGLAVFGNLDLILPIKETMQKSLEVLMKLRTGDWLADRYATIVADLQAACNTHAQKRANRIIREHRIRARELFGSVDIQTDTSNAAEPIGLGQDKGECPMIVNMRPRQERDPNLLESANVFGGLDRSETPSECPSHDMIDSIINVDEFWAVNSTDSSWLDGYAIGTLV